ncbi:hypothetical protein DXG01_005126 [Tephrocybe rancida]|nr:hypothetical protein DXG01_005126 [Tephrocybe rancida]
MDSARAHRLRKTLDAIAYGKDTLTPNKATLFIEAICAEEDRVSCLNKLIASEAGLDSVQAAFRFNLTTTFFNTSCSQLLLFLRSPELKDIGNGSFLSKTIARIVSPPIFWDAFRQAFESGLLESSAQIGFSWLLHHLVSISDPLQSITYRTQAPSTLHILLASSENAIRTYGQKIKHVLETCTVGLVIAGDPGPGGRHDNDFEDFRKIAILPTADEVMSVDRPFYRCSATVDSDPETTRFATHIDNQFRLLRDDMLHEMREELQIALGKKKGHHRGMVLDRLTLKVLHCGPDGKRVKWGLTFQCQDDIPHSQWKKEKNRKRYLTDNRNFLRHQSMGCLLVDDEIVAFPSLNRDEDLLAKKPPIIVLQIEGEAAVSRALLRLKNGRNIKLVQIDTAIFSYEPILKGLQHLKTLELSPELVLWNKNRLPVKSVPIHSALEELVSTLAFQPTIEIQKLLGTAKSIKLDNSQAASFLAGITQSVSLIQGPPGTGKSFIGSLVGKALHDFTKQTILVVCYTNHALDDILTNFLDIGIPEASIVRLGGKSTARTDPLTMHKQKSTFKRERDFEKRFMTYKSTNISWDNLMEYLEFEQETFHAAFQVPSVEDGSKIVGKGGKVIDDHHLLREWIAGRGAGIFRDSPAVRGAPDIWTMPPESRKKHAGSWNNALYQEQVDGMYNVAAAYNKCQDELARYWAEKDTEVLRSKRIIGCTTTAAAKYSDNIRAANPDVLLVEEAGEILESHVLTALAPETSQLILIGDHKQLRPKVNKYELTVEKDEGFDLNRSLFERLILKGYPHATLTQQHRMRPEISALIRELTYPELVDAPTTRNRPDLRGAQDNIIFINHACPEDNDLRLTDRRDGESTSSKQNTFEVDMVLKILKYLAQQGYGTGAVVILTPYLGQLQHLRQALKKANNDPVLNDLDSFDLVKAGLIPAATAEIGKRQVRLATIDNYQGEESDIVIISLTRSNDKNDIGFMFSPERLNVLLSRARDALIMIGNVQTFEKSRKGGDLWTHLFKLLKKGKHVYAGMPVRCEQHPDRTAILSRPEDFESHCPDGGCMEPCQALANLMDAESSGTLLNCGQHACTSKCHQLSDHSKMPCQHVVRSQCPNGHQQSWKCHQNRPATCLKCERDAEAADKKRQKDHELQQKRDADQLVHNRRMAELDEAIAQEQQRTNDVRKAEERAVALKQKKSDLETAKSRADKATLGVQSPPPGSPAVSSLTPADKATAGESPPPGSSIVSSLFPSSVLKAFGYGPPGDHEQLPQESSGPLAPVPKPKAPLVNTLQNTQSSPSELDWRRQKEVEGAVSPEIDQIMAMTGLEAIKEQVLSIKALIETKKRQGTSLKRERFNVVLLGNPGTGKTMVARSYGKLLSSLEVLPGEAWVETTGSRLANDGVAGIKAQLEEVKNAGGGTVFVDEAYQLTSQHNFQGKQVLDFLLAEMENNIGTIVFIFAGYRKEMETFFEHNPGLVSRVPFQLQFDDYTDPELLQMFKRSIESQFQGKGKVEGGIDGLYVRITIRRLGKGRGKAGFGNARALQNMLDQILRRQAKRLRNERSQGRFPDDLLICSTDLIGPDPSKTRTHSASWKKLQGLTGLRAVKESVDNLITLVDRNYQRELNEREPLDVSLNRIFIGSPGTGKTTVAKLYGQILADLGLLSNGEVFPPAVMVKNPSDFIGSVLGESETKTKAILATSAGKVLIIDEVRERLVMLRMMLTTKQAYMLYGGSGGVGKSNDIYKTAVIDTLVAEIQSVPGDDRCVLLLGYKDQMLEMFQNVNPGLSRRFALENAFDFEDFDDEQLLEILNFKLKGQDLSATEAAKAVAIEALSRLRNRPNFGNAGEVENLITQAKQHYQARLRSKAFSDIIFEEQDFDPDHDRGGRAASNLVKLFEDVVGCEQIVAQLGDYQRLAARLKSRKIADRSQIPTNFILSDLGADRNLGTGKTTIARKMGQVYYDMGMLSSKEVIECSASDLVGRYVGETGPKTKQLLEKTLGKVLFIDEAYRLSEGHFAKEAIDELVAALTLDKFKSKLIVILAGYDEDMNNLLSVNSGLASRFPEEVHFHNMKPERCLGVLQRELAKNMVQLPELADPSSAAYVHMSGLILETSTLPTWGNARDMIQLSKKMIQVAFLADTPDDGALRLSAQDAIRCVENMLKEQQGRSVTKPRGPITLHEPGHLPPLLEPPTQHAIRTAEETAENARIADGPTEAAVPNTDGRDPGVTDAVWRHLEACKAAIRDREKRQREEAEKLKIKIEEQKEAVKRQNAIDEELKRAKDDAERQELKRQREAARLKKLAAEQEVRRLEEKRQREAEEKRKEERVQQALRDMGQCVAGFRWINVGTGYQCAGGAHFVSNAQLPV